MEPVQPQQESVGESRPVGPAVSPRDGGAPTLVLVFQETTFRHFRKVRLKPDQFTSYLTESVGFSSYRLLTHTGRKPARTGERTCTGDRLCS